MEARIVLEGEIQFRGAADSGCEVVMDASEQFGGKNAGPRPMEMLLLSLAGCTSMDVISVLRKKREPVEGYEVRVSAGRAEEHPKVFTEIHVEHVVTGNVKEESLARAIELSETKYCSVRAMLRPETRMTTSYRIEPVR
jgi:putative redox protein